MTNAEIVVNKLIEKNYHIAFAESCTGGLCCAELVSVPNASKVLDFSVVTYANEAKMEHLGVKKSTIEENGVVSEQVAGEMSRGVANFAKADVGVATTGVAGPSGGTAKKPVGMVSFGIYIDGNVLTYTKQFGNIGRNEVRGASVSFIFEKLVECLS